ncbi:PIN domain-containing protein [Longimicrobium sp.]|jgi:predicted nucleic acid-binding protein|uniref:PIN domain-containing protein n=1 Tax=Longimicrobium sp. TaxID=2029185 RepID=UPI002ED93DBB
MTPSGALHILDTRLVVHVAKGDAIGQAVVARYNLRDRPDRPLIAITTVGELRRLSMSRHVVWTDTQRAQLQSLLREFVVVDINNESVLAAYADIGAALDNALNAIADRKLWVAAVAVAAGATLLTYDTDYQLVARDRLKLVFHDRAELAGDDLA